MENRQDVALEFPRPVLERTRGIKGFGGFAMTRLLKVDRSFERRGIV